MKLTDLIEKVNNKDKSIEHDWAERGHKELVKWLQMAGLTELIEKVNNGVVVDESLGIKLEGRYDSAIRVYRNGYDEIYYDFSTFSVASGTDFVNEAGLRHAIEVVDYRINQALSDVLDRKAFKEDLHEVFGVHFSSTTIDLIYNALKSIGDR